MRAQPLRSITVTAFALYALTLIFLLVLSSRVTGQVVAAKPDAPSPVLASYDFETPTPSGPDTFWLRENAGSVDLSTAFRWSGERSLHLREVAGDQDFSEFLAYFDERRGGTVYIQFYLLVTERGPTLNVGLAGSGWFLNPDQHGHAVWLQTHDGRLRHHPHDGWQDLADLRPFSWYFVDLMYDLQRGTYALALFEEGQEEPVVDRREQLNLTGEKLSSVRFLSFIGDLEDTDGFDFFIDDLLIATSPAVRQKPFVAPGRRSYFVEHLTTLETKLSPAERDDLFHLARQVLAASDSNPVSDDQRLLLERAADAAFAVEDLDLAETVYRRLAAYDRVRMWLKLADVAHLRGDVDEERRFREAIYGRLDLEEAK